MSIPSWCRSGHKVKCIATDRGWLLPNNGADTGPAVGDECTIRGVEVVRGFVALTFVEHRNEPRYRPNLGETRELAFDASFFRPLITQSDDLATHFEQHLRLSNPVREEA